MQSFVFSNGAMVMRSTLYHGNIKVPLFEQSHHWKIKEFLEFSMSLIVNTCHNGKIYNYTSKRCYQLELFGIFCFLPNMFLYVLLKEERSIQGRWQNTPKI